MQQVFLFIWGPFYQRLLESAKNKKFKSAVQAKLCSNYCQLLPCDEWFRRIFFVIKSVKQSSCILFVLWLRSLFLSYHSVALEFIHLEYTLHSIYSSNGASPILQYSILLHGMHEEAHHRFATFAAGNNERGNPSPNSKVYYATASSNLLALVTVEVLTLRLSSLGWRHTTPRQGERCEWATHARALAHI